VGGVGGGALVRVVVGWGWGGFAGGLDP